jgi:hypothetical protein
VRGNQTESNALLTSERRGCTDISGNSKRIGVTLLWRAAKRALRELGGIMSLQSRIESLKSRHNSLDSRISEEDHRPRPDSDMIAKLKLEKLRLKEEMDRLRTSPN